MKSAGYILTVVVFITADFAHSVNVGKCPFIKSSQRKHCKITSDCPKDHSCCMYLLNKSICVPTDPSSCYVDGKRIPLLNVFTSKDCLKCTCVGNDSLLCNQIKC